MQGIGPAAFTGLCPFKTIKSMVSLKICHLISNITIVNCLLRLNTFDYQFNLLLKIEKACENIPTGLSPFFYLVFISSVWV